MSDAPFFPANFVLPENMSLTNMFKTIGNGVPYLAARGIAASINHFLGNSQLDSDDNFAKLKQIIFPQTKP